MAEGRRYKRLENRRIAQVKLANDGLTLLVRFTDGGTAVIEADVTHLPPVPEPRLEIEVDGYA